MSPAPTATPCDLRGAVELVGTDRKSRLEVLGSEMAGDVEQHAPPDDPAPRGGAHPSRRAPPVSGDQAGPVSVVEGGVAADMAEPVELGRRLQGHHDVIVRHRIASAAPSAAEHAVAGRHPVEVQRLGSVAARRRRTDRQRE